MSKIKRLWFFTLISLLVLAGCSSAANATTQAPDNPQKDLPESEAAVNAAVQALAERLGVEGSTITLVSVEKAQWRDSCLGVALPGLVCAQVITPGYKIILDSGGTQHEVHTDETGKSIAFAAQDTN